MKSRIKKSTILIMVLINIVTALYIFNLININSQIKELEDQISKEEELIALLEIELENFEDILTSQGILKYYLRFPAEDGYPQLLQAFNKISLKNTVDITSITLNAANDSSTAAGTEENPPYQILSYTIQTSSNSYNSTRIFLQDMHDIERIINVTELEITQKNEKIISNFDVEVYYSKAMAGFISELKPVDTYAPASRINPFKY